MKGHKPISMLLALLFIALVTIGPVTAQAEEEKVITKIKWYYDGTEMAESKNEEYKYLVFSAAEEWNNDDKFKKLTAKGVYDGGMIDLSPELNGSSDSDKVIEPDDYSFQFLFSDNGIPSGFRLGEDVWNNSNFINLNFPHEQCGSDLENYTEAKHKIC